MELPLICMVMLQAAAVPLPAPGEYAEHGKSYDRAVHVVHKSDKSKLAVLGMFMKPGKRNTVAKAVGETEV